MSSRGSGRLPTFKTRRDLTLGGKNIPVGGAASVSGRNRNMFGAGATIKKPAASPILSATGSSISGEPATVTKKKFTPNLNVARRQTSNENNANVNLGQWKSTPLRKGQSCSSPKKREQRKTYPKQEFIQTMGAVFSEGIGEGRGGIRRSKFGGGAAAVSLGSGEGEGRTNVQRPKINLNIKVDKEEEAERLKELLRDDFIDDLTQGPLVPVQLPMIDTGTAFKEENTKDDIKIDQEIKGEKEKNSHSVLDSDDDSDIVDNQNDMKIKLYSRHPSTFALDQLINYMQSIIQDSKLQKRTRKKSMV